MGCINEIGVKPEADNVSGLLGDVGLADYIRETYAALTPKGFIIRIGIDNFSAINTNYGMAYGDYILKKTADCIANTLNSNQRLFKLVSDEFMIVDFSGSNITEAIKIYMNCKKNVNKFIEDNNYKIMYTLSAGVIDASHIKDEDDSYIKLSEFALKQAKDSGKNTYYIYRNEDFEHYNRRRVINTALHNAVDDDFAGFEVYYQPIVDTKTYRLIGAEALMRFFMPDPDGGSPQFVSPVEFIPLLEESGLIIPVGKWILEQSARQCAIWTKQIESFRINVNVSYIQVIKSDVLTDIMAAINDNGIKPYNIGIELTESGYLDSNPHFNELWSKLKDNGVVVVLDDFGTGYSNLHCLSDLKPDYIKIDRSFTVKALKNHYDYELLTYIIQMTHSLSLSLCIEGVETPEELDELRRINPDYIQGYLFGKPYPANEFDERFM